jgi:hypothetical protein
VFALWTRHIPVVGDEPHYVIMADSVAHDFDFDLRNNYEQDRERRVIIGPITPHMRRIQQRWMPYHTPGLGVLLAVPFVIGGNTACRASLGILAAVLPFTLFGWFSRTMSRAAAVWLVMGVCISVPILFGSILIFPDLPAGAIGTALVVWVLARAKDVEPVGTRIEWASFWCLAGLLPWLNIKFAPTTVVLALGGAAVAWRARHAPAARRAWSTLPLIAVGPAALLLFNITTYGPLLGSRATVELTSSPMRALLIFLGLHFDQSQGMFLQQPLLLLGVALIVPFFRRNPWMAAFWLAAYLSLIAPNAFELARFGMAGPDGRFGWSAEWLWMLPLGVLRPQDSAKWERWLKGLAAAALVYQLVLAMRWLPAPVQLFPVLQESLAQRDSLFPTGMRPFVPSYYLWDFKSYLIYPPNVAAMLVTIGVMFAGAFRWRGTVNRT